MATTNDQARFGVTGNLVRSILIGIERAMLSSLAMALLIFSNAGSAADAGDIFTNVARLSYSGAVVPLETRVDFTLVEATGSFPPTDIVYFCVDTGDQLGAPGCPLRFIAENAPGQVLATLAVVDGDQASGHTLTVSDPRFDIAGDALKLVDGIALDFEAEPQVVISVTATDQANNQLTLLFEIVVVDANEAPFDLVLANNFVVAGSPGVRVGLLTVQDVDASDLPVFSVDDPRFVVDAENFLSLAPGEALEPEVDVPIVITATDQGGLTTSLSVVVTTDPDNAVGDRTPSTIALQAPDTDGLMGEYGPGSCDIPASSSQGGYPVPELPATLVVGSADAYAVGDLILLTVVDPDQDLQPAERDSVSVVVSSPATFDQETILLIETGEQTGVFRGVLPTTAESAVLEDCQLSVTAASEIEVTYTDALDSADVSSITVDVGPVSLVFDDEAGEPLDGVVLTLVNVATGAPATVYGNGPGFARYPATVKSGEPARDQSGNVYAVGPGEFRFPAVAAGTYRLEVFNTAAFQNSGVGDEELQLLDPALGRSLQHTSSGRYVLSDASRGLVFHVPQGAVPRIDVPIRVIPRNVTPTPSTIEFLQYSTMPGVGETVDVQQTNCVAGQAQQIVELRGVAVPVPGLVNLVATEVIKAGQPVFVRVTDQDQNQDPAVRERITIQLDAEASGDREYLELTETEPDSGQFVGYVQTVEGEAQQGNCNLGVVKNEPITTSYTDAFDNTDSAETIILVDPFGVVFSTRDGTPIDGVTITLIDVATGQPAQVFGDGPTFADYPSTLVTGTGATDGAGLVYDFPPGEYRFPFVAPGFYRLQLDNVPSGRIFPSTTDAGSIQSLPGAPFAVVTGSRGEVFEVPIGPALNIDVPIDEPSANMFVTKSASKDIAAIGDFVQYRITATNAVGNIVAGSQIVDRLPKGFRYRSGSLRVDGTVAADPAIAGDGRTMTIDLPAGGATAIEVSYVTEVTVGAGTGIAINEAMIVGDLVANSNIASARVIVREDLFRDKAIVVGRVTLSRCDTPAAEAVGMPGVRIFLEDGSYVVTDDAGAWYMEGIEPGSHVVQLDVDSLDARYEASPCNQNSRFAGSPYSQFVDVGGGTLWRADFRVQQKPDPVSNLELTQTMKVDKEGVWVSILAANTGDVDVDDVNLIYTVPKGWQIVDGSGVLDGDPINYSQTIVGSVWHLGNLSKERELRFRLGPSSAAGVSAPVPSNRLFEMQPRFSTRSATLDAADKRDIDGLIAIWREGNWDEMTIVGHTDNVPIAPENRQAFRNNGELSYARALAVAEYVASRVEIPRINVVGAADRFPIAANDTKQGRTQNRRVEFLLKGAQQQTVPQQLRAELFAGESVARLSFRSAGSPKGRTESNRLPLEQLSGAQKTVSTSVTAEAIGSWDLVEAMPVAELPRDPNLQGLISPVDGARLSRPVAGVKVDLDSRLRPRLTLDGAEIGKDRIGFMLEDPATGKTLYNYVGVDFGGQGKRSLTLQGIDGFGNVRFEESATIVRVGDLFDIRVVETEGNVADGRTPVKVKLALLDNTGERINVPHKLILESRELARYDRKLDLTELAMVREHNYVDVDSDGYLLMNPVSTSGVYRATLRYENRQRDIEIFVEPEKRDWIMVGLAEGTLAHRQLSGNMRGLDEAGFEDEFDVDGKAAFYAKGQIMGEYILTLAYDSSKRSREALGQVIDPNAYYPLYGDKSTTQYDAASREKLYIKLERNQFYALFGDFTTGLTVNELSNYSRAMTGFKTEYESDRFEVSAFVSESDQAFVKDEIRGDGTSGLYRFSTPGLIMNSESIRIETRDRFHSQEIINERAMQRHIDYTIDYDAGTVFFKEPVFSQDTAFNPVFIVADYEVEGGGKNRINAGGRFAYKPIDGAEFGVTLIREGAGTRDSDLAGLDFVLEINDTTELRAELASTRNEDGSVNTTGTAYLAEIVHQGPALSARAYVREQEGGFGLGQQSAGETDTRKLGVEARYDVREDVEVVGEVYRQTNLATGTSEDVAATTLQMTGEKFNVNTGLRSAASEDSVSNQVLVGGSYRLLDGKVILNANADTPIGGKGEAANFPKRLRVGLDYKLTSGITLKAEQEFSWGDEVDTQGTRIGMVSRLWEGAEFTTSVQQQADQENAQRLAAVAGLKQRWQFNDVWSFDFGVDRSQTLNDKRVTPPLEVTAVYAAPGSDDFTAVSFGSRFRKDAWDWATRVEYRGADSEDKLNVLSDVIHNLDEGQQLLASVDYQQSDSDTASRTTTDIQLGYAFRPVESRWTLFNRLDLVQSESTNAGFDLLTQKIVNNLNANYLLGSDTQLALQYGAKYVVDNFDSDEYRGFTDLYGMEIRHDISPRWDVGLQGSVYRSGQADVSEQSYGVSVGYSMARNVWMSLGYNFSGFDDDDFHAAEYTSKGVFLKYRVKFDQFTARSILDRMQD